MTDMTEIFLPTLHTFAMKNTFTGSCGNLRFKIEPNVVKLTDKEVDMENSSIKVQYWYGPFCFEKSQIEGEETFPMSEDGREAMRSWLGSKV